MTSGYVPCGCRDCGEVAVGHDGDLCLACEQAGCEPDSRSECCAPHTYCDGDSRSGGHDLMIDGVAHCPVCELPW